MVFVLKLADKTQVIYLWCICVDITVIFFFKLLAQFWYVHHPMLFERGSKILSEQSDSLYKLTLIEQRYHLFLSKQTMTEHHEKSRALRIHCSWSPRSDSNCQYFKRQKTPIFAVPQLPQWFCICVFTPLSTTPIKLHIHYIYDKSDLTQFSQNISAPLRPELLEHLQEMREEKKRIRKTLHDFEDNFFRQNGR